MRFLQVAFLAFLQLTAVPLVGALTAQSLAPQQAQSSANTITIAYKTAE